MVFLFNGGNCDQSFNVQEASGKFFCEDFGAGPPTERGEKAFIVVTALKDDTVYHNDWAEVGQLYTLFDGGNNFVADQLITIYNSSDTANPSNILQAVQYHSSCSQNLFLKDRFGASQLVIWVNEDQGTISCFANQTFELDVTVPIEFEGGPATVTSLTVASNVDPFFFNLTDKVAGTQIDAGDTLEVSIAIPIDLTQKQTYNLLITLVAVTLDGRDCRATDLISFTAGYPLPPIFPTFSPTQAPSGGLGGQVPALPAPAPGAPTASAPTVPAQATLATIVDFAAGNPDFSTLVDLVTQAGLVDTLNGSGPFTVFAPTNAAFASLPQETLDAVSSDPALLTSVLTYHVVGGTVLSTDLVDGAAVETVNGATVTVSLNPDMINDANIVATDLLASNGVIHVIDSVCFLFIFLSLLYLFWCLSCCI